jgi:hypothetical protein
MPGISVHVGNIVEVTAKLFFVFAGIRTVENEVNESRRNQRATIIF